jgi:pyridoxal 5'-phosphate synthase pdxS subunit
VRRVYDRVYAVGQLDLSQEGAWMAAVLACGSGAALSHESAAQLWAIRPRRRHLVEVSVPSRRDPRPGRIRVHRRRDVGDVRRVRGIPATSPGATLTDLATRLGASHLERAIGEADKLGLITPEQLRVEVEGSRRPGAKALRDVLDGPTFALTDSELERLFVPIALAAGLPLPQTRQRILGHRVDFYWADRDLVVETDGLTYHRTPAQQKKDRVRDQELTAAGLTIVRFTHDQIAHEPDSVAGSCAAYDGSVREEGTFRVKAGLAEMLKGGVIMDVVTADQARVAEAAGAVAVMALERVPADIRAAGGVARMADPTKIAEIQEAVTIPVMAKARIGHFVEARVLEALEVDYIDESEVLTPADEANHIDKWDFKVPFVCGATNLGEALRRIGEGAAMIRSKGEAGTGNVVEAVRHMRSIKREISRLAALDASELATAAKELQAPLELVKNVAEAGRLPVVLFCAGGIATPADAALMMQLGAEGNFVGSGIFKSEDPERTARAIVEATTHFDDAERVAAASRGLGEAMKGLEISTLGAENGGPGLLQTRGW